MDSPSPVTAAPPGDLQSAGADSSTPLEVRRHSDIRLVPDSTRIVLRPFVPGESLLYDGSDRIDAVVKRLLALTDDEVSSQLAAVSREFAGRHRDDDFDRAVDDHFGHVAHREDLLDLSEDRRRLIGLYFTHEYSVEAAALGNPSIVAAPDQSDLAPGELRALLSLRSVGEGHRSSISFRTIVVDRNSNVRLEPVSEFISTGRVSSATYDRAHFRAHLLEREMSSGFAERVLNQLDAHFDRTSLDAALRDASSDTITNDDRAVARSLVWLADSNYVVEHDPVEDISSRILFPQGPAETSGMEDARLVRFVDDDDSVRYFATYTAFDGRAILPQLIETKDFARFRVSTLRGSHARNKGIALFPRKIDGQFVALGRHDNVNNFLMRSTSVRNWDDFELIQEPSRPWELTQLGNCGSPIETDAGWLVMTHGVGAMRKYAIGALLLDIDDPANVIGHLRDPLIEPNEEERDGYVPNVVYSCGSLVYDGQLIIPYGFSDLGASVATLPLDDVLSRLI